MDSVVIYKTIRKEIVDQKHCQFQIFSLAITATALIIAYAASSKSNSLVYVAPIILNTFVLIMILNKSVSIQRKVGYLQFMEQNSGKYNWFWETQLDQFRKKVPLRPSSSGDPARKHSYITSVGLMLIWMNLLSFVFFLLSIDYSSLNSLSLPAVAIIISAIIAFGLLLYSIGKFILERKLMIDGRNSGPSIFVTWSDVMKEYIVKP